MGRSLAVLAGLFAGLVGCRSAEAPVPGPPEGLLVEVVDAAGQPLVGALVLQGGAPESGVKTAAHGRARVRLGAPVDPGAEQWVIAALPGHRSDGVELLGDLPAEPVRITLRPVPVDNPDYLFGEPGVDDGSSSAQCSHCHRSLAEGFGRSGHRRAASNPVTQDIWFELLGPLPPSERAGDCADCHAPGVDGPPVRGRDLGEVDGIALSDGVHCDFCHKIRDVRPERPPGVGERILLGRPSDGPGLMQEWKAAMYGPYPDVLNPFMGGVWTPMFREARFCGGCHEHRQTPPGGGEPFPVQTTVSEFEASAFSKTGSCRDCHMPPLDRLNAADLDPALVPPGVAGGFRREPGEVRDHSFPGALDLGVSGVRMIEQALGLTVSVAVRGRGAAGAAGGTANSDPATAQVEVKLRNQGAGHSVPTGDPMRSLVLAVRGEGCGEVLSLLDGPRVDAVGGRAQPSPPAPPPADLGLPLDGAPVRPLEGAPGRTYARVLHGRDGEQHTPHGLAHGLTSDTRIRAGEERTEAFTFSLPAGCGTAEAEAVVLYRRYPVGLARQRGWPQREVVAARARASSSPP